MAAISTGLTVSMLSLLTITLCVNFSRGSHAQVPSGQLSGPQSPDRLDAVAPPSPASDRIARSRAMFVDIAKVLTGPRCMNCHPAGDHPLQGDNHAPHRPAALRGPDGDGVPGLLCASCHTDRNVTLMSEEAPYRSIPGHPRWELAPLEMAWEGKSTGEICRQLKDPQRNGGRSLAMIQEHIAKDDLVGWAWNPGTGREPAPGTQKELGDLVQAWIDVGAECP
jgi:hypothetical protein